MTFTKYLLNIYIIFYKTFTENLQNIHVSHVVCQVLHVMCNVSHVTGHLSIKWKKIHIFLCKVMEVVGGGSVINGAYLV